MREREIRNFFATEPSIHPQSLASVGRWVVSGLELGEYRRIRGAKLRVAKKIAKTLIFNSTLLGIQIPPVGHDEGHLFNQTGEREDHFAHLGLFGDQPGIIFSDLYLQALIKPDRYGADLHLRSEPLESVVAHECFHLKQVGDYPWKAMQDALRSDANASSWDNARSEIAAKRFAEVFDAERTRLQRKRNTLIFLQDMGIDGSDLLINDENIAASNK